MRAVVFGTGAVGARSARQLASLDGVDKLVLVDDDTKKVEAAVQSLGDPAEVASIAGLRQETRLERFREVAEGVDLVVVTAPDDHVEIAEVALELGAHVVSVSDDVETVQDLLQLDDLARSKRRNLVVGAGFAPGLSCLLARHAATRFDDIDEMHVAKFGTGGPACARQHHKALRGDAIDWRNQMWETRRGGTGRELCWFPDPVGGLDCYQAAMPDAFLLLAAFPSLQRASGRVAATRRDMSTKWLPMLRRPHPEGMIGAIRVEVRGTKNNTRGTVVLGALDRPAVAAGTVAAIAGVWANQDRFMRQGAAGLAELVDDPVPFLRELSDRGVRAAIFEGSRDHD